jgi:hypothetical protein
MAKAMRKAGGFSNCRMSVGDGWKRGGGQCQ